MTHSVHNVSNLMACLARAGSWHMCVFSILCHMYECFIPMNVYLWHMYAYHMHVYDRHICTCVHIICTYTIGIECMRTRCICIPSAFCLRIHRCMYTIGMHLYKKGRRFVHVWRTTTALDDHSADKSARVMRVRGMRELGSMMFRMWMRVRL